MAKMGVSWIQTRGIFIPKFFVWPHMCCPQLDIVLLSCGNSDMGAHGKLCGLTLQKHHGPMLGRCSQFKGESPPQSLEDVLYEALNAHGQLAACKSHQEK